MNVGFEDGNLPPTLTVLGRAVDGDHRRGRRRRGREPGVVVVAAAASSRRRGRRRRCPSRASGPSPTRRSLELLESELSADGAGQFDLLRERILGAETARTRGAGRSWPSDLASGSLRPSPARRSLADAVALPPLSEGAAIGPGTVDGAVLDDGAEALALGWFSIFIVRGTWKASRPSRSTPPTAAMIFCRLALALGSNVFGHQPARPRHRRARARGGAGAGVVVVGVVVVVAGVAPLAPVAPVAGAGDRRRAARAVDERVDRELGADLREARRRRRLGEVEIESIANSRPVASSAPCRTSTRLRSR